MKNESLTIASDLQIRLKALAAKTGNTVEELAEQVLRSHADEQERNIIEISQDEKRWQAYLETGQTVSMETVRGKLHSLAAQSASKAEPQ